MGRRTKLTPQTHSQIVATIRAGAFDWVAAEAAGIDRATFYRWMADDRKLYRDFRDEVREAHAQARTSCELEVRKANPLAWLRLGPGRDRTGAPGWTEQTEIHGPEGGPALFTIEIKKPVTDDS